MRRQEAEAAKRRCETRPQHPYALTPARFSSDRARGVHLVQRSDLLPCERISFSVAQKLRGLELAPTDRTRHAPSRLGGCGRGTEESLPGGGELRESRITRRRESGAPIVLRARGSFLAGRVPARCARGLPRSAHSAGALRRLDESAHAIEAPGARRGSQRAALGLYGIGRNEGFVGSKASQATRNARSCRDRSSWASDRF